MHRRKNNRVRPEFRVEYQPTIAPYAAMADKNLQYFFGVKENRKILRKNGIINRNG